jgi:hypothetical protein
VIEIKVETIDIISNIEERFKVDQWIIEGVHIWPFLRLKLGQRLEIKKYTNFPKVEIKKFSYLLRVLRAIFTARNPITKIGDCDTLILNDGSGFYLSSEGVKNRHYDHLITAHKNATSVKLEFLNYAKPNMDIKNYKAYNIESWLDKQYLISFAQSLVVTKYKRYMVTFDDEYAEFTAYIKSIGIYHADFSLEKIRIFVERWKSLCKKLESSFRHLQDMRICYVGTYYGYYGLALTTVLKGLKVKVCEVQHGLQGKSHYAYSNWKVPINGYAQIPEYFIVWTKVDKETLDKWNPSSNVFIVGIPVENLQRNQMTLRSKDKNCITVLYSCSDFLIEKQIGLLKTISTIDSIRMHILIRAHPSDLNKLRDIKSYLDKLKLQNYELFQSSQMPLADVISNADVHITISSSVAIEVNVWTKKSLILRKYGASVLESYNIGLFEYFETAGDLLRLLNNGISNDSNRKAPVNEEVQTYERAEIIVRTIHKR